MCFGDCLIMVNSLRVLRPGTLRQVAILLRCLVLFYGFNGLAFSQDFVVGASRNLPHKHRELSTLNLSDDAGLNFIIESKARLGGGAKPARHAALTPIQLNFGRSGEMAVPSLPIFDASLGGKFASRSQKDEVVFFTLDPDLQAFSESLVKQARAPHVAIVVMEPRSGKILALADKSLSIKDLALHSGFPAASIFKLVTSAAALEEGGLQPDTLIHYRGGTYTLNQWNYNPDPKKDRLNMSMTNALGRSCNAVFSRIALKYLSAATLRRYSKLFGFNSEMRFDVPLPPSSATIPIDNYNLGRTAAGFGQVTLSPIHAAALVAAIANDGILRKPILIDKVISESGSILFEAEPLSLKRVILPSTARTLLRMMLSTTTIGTARKDFSNKKGVLSRVGVAAKTGTLRGTNPKGLNHWFIAAAPVEAPVIAISVISVDPSGTSGRASYIGKKILDRYFSSR